MKDVLQLESHRASTNERDFYPTLENLEELFVKQNTELLRLSLQLTADDEKAECCLIRAMRDCFFSSNVSKDRLHAWVRRMVIRNAIRMVWGTPNDNLCESAFEFQLQPSILPLEKLRESVAILTLPDLDRLAFVICVLERYSLLDCALLLRTSPREVNDAIVRAKSLILPREERSENEATTKSPVNMNGVFWEQRNAFEDSCGSIFD